MNTVDFLRMVWPSTGTYLIVVPVQYVDRQTQKVVKTFKHYAFPTIDAAAAGALALSTDRTNPVDVFFALASVKEDLTHMRKADREAAGKKVRGVHKSGYDNTQAVKCFWLDLDVGAEQDKYATQQEAAAQLRGFCQSMGLPKPFVSSSGGGLHVYWPLTNEVEPEKWQHYASILKTLADSWGLRQDRTRTADRASVLRPVGTFNWKTGEPRPVSLLLAGAAVDTTLFIGRLAYLAETMNLPPVEQRKATMTIAGTPLAIPGAPLAAAMDVASMNEAAAAGAGYEQPDPREVVMACQQLGWQAVNQGSVAEPLWYAMIGCLRHAKNGAKAIHMMSRQSPLYDAHVTDLKIRQHEDGGYPPTLCQTFEQHRPGGCDGCPLKGRIKTPLQTVRKLEQVQPPAVQLATTTGGVAQVQLPPPPAPFKRVINPLTGKARIAMTIGDKKGNEEDVVIYEYDIYPSKLVFSEREGCYNVVLTRWLPKDGEKEFEVPAGKLYDRKQLAMTLGNIGVLPDQGQVENLVAYVIGYLRDLQKVAAASVVYAQLGWRPERDKFVMPDRVIGADGIEHIPVPKNIARHLSFQPPRGSLDVWKQLMATYERPNMVAHQFGFGVGFASPLFIFTNYNGMLVSLIGKAGAGKSSAALSANSIWGHPKLGWADRENDTQRAFVQKLGVLNNLPATYDEHTNLEGELVSDLAYMVSKGQGRQRLQSDSTAAENHGNWNLMMLMTGNTSLNSRLVATKADASAESARVFEYWVPENTLAKAEADKVWGPGGALYENFGLAGDVYIQYLIKNKDWAKERIKYWVSQVDAKASVSSGERFWSAGVACVLTGFELANQCGLTNADVQRLLQFAVGVINGMRVAVVESTRSPVGTLSEYLNSNLRSTLVVGSEALGRGGLAQVNHSPTDKLRIRHERHTGLVFVDRADFRRHCADVHLDSNVVLRELEQAGVLKQRDARMVLGRGTPLATTQTYCLVFDANHAAVGGAGQPATPQLQAVP